MATSTTAVGELDTARRRLADALLEESTRLADRLAERGHELPGYERAGPPQTRRAENEALVTYAICGWRDRTPIDELGALIEPVAEARSAQGVPVDSVLRGLQLATEEIWGAARDAANALALGPVVLEDFADWLMRVLHSVMSATAIAFADTSVHDSADRRERLWADLVSGQRSESQLRARALAVGLDVARHYVPFRTHADPGEAPKALIVMSRLGSDLAGIVVDPALIRSLDAPVGVGPPAPLIAIGPAFAEASQALEVAAALALRGVHSLDSLGVRVAVVGQPDIGDRLIRRYIEPLKSEGEFGDTLLESVLAYFDNGRQVERAARALSIHGNTMRHRLQRFEELTGANLSRNETAFEIWWALEAYRPRRRSD